MLLTYCLPWGCIKRRAGEPQRRERERNWATYRVEVLDEPVESDGLPIGFEIEGVAGGGGPGGEGSNAEGEDEEAGPRESLEDAAHGWICTAGGAGTGGGKCTADCERLLRGVGDAPESR